MATSEKTLLNAIDAPDFYWQYKLERLSAKKGVDLPFKISNYPDATSPKSLYDAYHLDLTLQGKLNDFDWVTEQSVSDSEWLAIYKSICKWSAATLANNKPQTSTLPANEFDLVKQFHPQLNYRDLETPFSVEEVGENFPFRNLKDLLSSALQPNFKLPKFSSVTTLEASEIRSELASLKANTFKNIDAVYSKCLNFAKEAYPDEEARAHYQKVRADFADFPQTTSEWANYRKEMDKVIDNMAALASKQDDPHGHHHHDEHHGEEVATLSAAQEFELKFGKNLDDMQELMSKFKQNPEEFFQTSIVDKYGKSGLDILSKSQGFSSSASVLSDSDKAKAEASFKEFLQKA